MYSVYILQSEVDQSYYTGQTQDLEDRLKRHNEGRSKSTKLKRPWKIVYVADFTTRSDAVQLEMLIKSKHSKKYIEQLVNESKINTCNNKGP